MPIYFLTCDVTSARGTQTFRVQAANKDEALQKFSVGEVESVEEDVEVMGLGEPEIEEVQP